MPHLLRSSLVLLLVLWFGAGTALAQGTGRQVTEPLGAMLALGDADAHDDHAHDENDHDDHAHDDHDQGEHHHEEPAYDDHAHGEPEHDDHAHDEHEHGEPEHDDHDHVHGTEGTRLLVASLDGPEMIVLDAEAGTVVGRFTVPGPGTAHQLPNAQLAAVVHRETNRVTFVHSGLTTIDHGDHADLLVGSPYVLSTVNLGREPSTLFAAGNDIAVWLAGDGGAAWLDARLLGVSLDFVEVAGPGVGSVARSGVVAAVDGHLVVAGADGAAVRVHDRRANEVAAFGGCPAPQGQAVLGDVAAFGCSDGVLLVQSAGGGVFTSHKIAHPPGGPADARVRTLVAHAGGPLVVGGFGQGVALIDVVTRTARTVPLPAEPTGMRLAEDGEVLLVLTKDGYLHALDPASGAVDASVRVTGGAAAGEARPSLATLGGAVFVADPEHREIVRVDVDHMEVEARWPLPFTPGSLAAMGIEGAIRH